MNVDRIRPRRLAVLTATSALAAAGLVAVAAPPAAHAGPCSSETGGSSEWVMWTGKGFTCAYQAKSDKKKIGSFNTQTWTHGTALGYSKREHKKKHTGGVDISSTYVNAGSLGSSVTFTAFNTEDGSRHWGAAVIWNTESGGKVSDTQYKGDGYEFKTNRFHVSKISVSGPSTTPAGTQASFTVKVTDPDGGTTPTGGVALMMQAGDKQSPTTKNCDGSVKTQGADTGVGQAALSGGTATLKTPPLAAGTYKFYAAYAGTLNSKNVAIYCDKPSQQGLTGAQSSTFTLTVTGEAGRAAERRALRSAPAETVLPAAASAAPKAGRTLPIAVVDRELELGRDGAAPRPMACPKGWLPLQINFSSPSRVLPEDALTRDGSKLGVRAGAAPAGTHVDLQVVCRPASATPRFFGKVVLGSAGADELRTRKRDSTVLAGRGNDTTRVTTLRSAAFGFTGNDRIVVDTARGSAHGGPGADLLTARKPGAVLLVGGAGPDRFHGADGRTLINARDGAGHDRIHCHSAQNVVLADKGDTILGPCTVR